MENLFRFLVSAILLLFIQNISFAQQSDAKKNKDGVKDQKVPYQTQEISKKYINSYLIYKKNESEKVVTKQDLNTLKINKYDKNLLDKKTPVKTQQQRRSQDYRLQKISVKKKTDQDN